MVIGLWRKDLFFEILGTDGVMDGFFELLVLIGFYYLYFVFRGKFKATNLPVYRFLSMGFGFTVLSILIPMIAIFVGTALVGDSVIDQMFLFNDIPYYLTTALSLVCFIVAAKQVELKTI